MSLVRGIVHGIVRGIVHSITGGSGGDPPNTEILDENSISVEDENSAALLEK